MTQKAILWQNVGVPPARPDPRVQMRGMKLFQTERRKTVSGSGQAKAKKKSAKKAVAGSAPAPAPESARPEEFIIGNVRCFAEEQRVPIRPITLLVGANSTGKTTFLGGYRVLHNLTASPLVYYGEGLGFSFFTSPLPSFNDEPFCMGAFRDIVNHGILKHPAPSFQLGAKIPFWAMAREQKKAGKTRQHAARKNLRGKLDLIYSFQEVGASAVAHRATVRFSNGEKIDLVMGKDLGKDRLEKGLHPLAIVDPRTGRQVNVGDLMMSMRAHEIAIALASIHRKLESKAQKDLKNIDEVLNRQFYPDCPKEMSQRLLSLAHDSAEYSLAPIRSKPKRTYNPASDDYNPEGDHIPMILAQLFRSSQKEWEFLRQRLVAFGKESGMFSDFKVKGLGKHVSDPFQIHVKAAGVMSNLIDVGYGVGQIYPLLVQIMRATQHKVCATFLLQEPEVHLHPQAQAALTSFFAKSVKDDGHAFIMETHGDAIIDRVRICVSHGEIAPEDVVILYFEADKKTGAVKIHPIHVDKMGNLTDAPPGYRRFFLEEINRMLRPPKK